MYIYIYIYTYTYIYKRKKKYAGTRPRIKKWRAAAAERLQNAKKWRVGLCWLWLWGDTFLNARR